MTKMPHVLYCSDTFFKNQTKGGVAEMRGRVGAAHGIHVSRHADTACCDTFAARSLQTAVA